jgi:hypothetical protein
VSIKEISNGVSLVNFPEKKKSKTFLLILTLKIWIGNFKVTTNPTVIDTES